MFFKFFGFIYNCLNKLVFFYVNVLLEVVLMIIHIHIHMHIHILHIVHSINVTSKLTFSRINISDSDSR